MKNAFKYCSGVVVAASIIAVNLALIFVDSRGHLTFITGGLLSVGAGVFWVMAVEMWSGLYQVEKRLMLRLVFGVIVLFVSMEACSAAIPHSLPVHYRSGVDVMSIFRHGIEAVIYFLLTLFFSMRK